MYILNKKIADLTPYEPIKGEYKIRLDANESCFNLPPNIINSINKGIEEMDFNRYPDPNATELCKSFAGYYNIDSNLVTAGNGSDEIISLILNSFLMKGEKLVVLEPDFSMYRFYSSVAEVECVTIEKNADLSIDINKVIEIVNSQKINAIIFSNPCNPTSKGINTLDIKKLLSSVNALVILDEAYMDFWNNSLLKNVNDFDNLIILRTASKAVGVAAIRLGFAIANKRITNAIKAVKSPYNVNSITQMIGTIIYSDVNYLYNVKNRIVSNRLELYNGVSDIVKKSKNRLILIDGVTNFVFLKSKESKEIYTYLLTNGVAIRYMGEYIRITAGTHEENEELLKLLNNYLS